MSAFVTFEGIEGSGKSSHLRRLAAHLRAAGRSVVETREPGGTPAGEAIRRLLLGREATPLVPLAELLLYLADRSQHLAAVVRPALTKGHIVLSDRFSDSTLAYQGFGRGLPLELVRALGELFAHRRLAERLAVDLHVGPRVGHHREHAAPGRLAPAPPSREASARTRHAR